MSQTVTNGQANQGGLLSMLALSAGQRVGGRNQLDKTAALTATSTTVANDILKTINDPANAENEQLAALVKQSMTEHGFMDDLINRLVDLKEVDVDYLYELMPVEDDDEATKAAKTEEVDKMLRSQQSKRSRAKTKDMNLENYKTMLVGAVAENLIRLTFNKPKNAGDQVFDGELSEERIKKLSADAEELKKAIRNVQSKKSIMQSKNGFSKEDPKYQALLVEEAALKKLRDAGSKELTEQAQQALETQRNVEELLAEVDTTAMTAEQAKTMIDSLKEMLASK